MSDDYIAVAAGHICLDVIPPIPANAGSFDKIFLPGRLIEVGPATFSSGGPVSNTGLAMNKLGIKTQLMGKIGADSFGQAIKNVVSSYGADLAAGLVVDHTINTSYTIIINPPGVDRIFMHHPGANDTFRADDVRYDQVAQARLFHFGYPPIMKLMYENKGAQLVEVLRRAKTTGVTTSLDMALPDPSSAAGRADWVTILGAALPYVDIFLPSAEELLYTLRRQTYDELAGAAEDGDILPLFTPELLSDMGRQLLEMGVKIAVIKLGYRGIYVRTAGQETLQELGRGRPTDLAAWAAIELWAPAFETEVVGAAGSGDSAIAGFLCAFLRDMSLAEALTAAVAVGACNVEAADTLSGLRSWDETMARVAGNWARRSLTLAAPGWRFDPARRLWVGPAGR